MYDQGEEDKNTRKKMCQWCLYLTSFSSLSIVDFEIVNVCWNALTHLFHCFSLFSSILVFFSNKATESCVGIKVKGRISQRWFSGKRTLCTCVYQGANVRFPENLACFVFLRPSFWFTLLPYHRQLQNIEISENPGKNSGVNGLKVFWLFLMEL